MKNIKTWHDYRHELDAALASDMPDTFAAVIGAALGADHVKRVDDMLVEGNDDGRSYNSMGQSDVGLTMIRAGLKWGNDGWFNDGVAAFNVMLTRYGAGGLRMRDADTGTAWYCGQTSRDHHDKGGTLNKHLYATQAFLQAAETLRVAGLFDLAEKYQTAGEEGFLKLVQGKSLPMLKDYFVTKGDTDHVTYKSWVYYGASHLEREFFLANDEKNANYHLYDMKLIFQIGSMMDDSFDWSQFDDKQLGKHTALGGMLQVYENKLDAGGLTVDTPVEYGQFSRTLHGEADALDHQVTDWLAIWA